MAFVKFFLFTLTKRQRPFKNDADQKHRSFYFRWRCTRHERRHQGGSTLSNYYGIEVTGIRRGYEGMINGEFFTMDRKSVSNIIQRGGTILKTARSEQFKTPKAADWLTIN
jgi:hypothetical protein